MENVSKSLDRHVAGEKYHRIFRNRTRPVFHPVCIRRPIVIIIPVFFQFSLIVRRQRVRRFGRAEKYYFLLTRIRPKQERVRVA